MTEDLALLEAGLFQLRAAAESVDPMLAPQMQLTIGILANSIAAAASSFSAAAVNDIEFALNDVIATVDQLNAADADRVAPALAVLREDLARLRNASALPPAVVEAVRAFQSKLRVRRGAIERQTYREGGGGDPLPHPPEELHADAGALRPFLSSAGFSTPALDALIADPSSLRFHSISEILDELDVIVG